MTDEVFCFSGDGHPAALTAGQGVHPGGRLPRDQGGEQPGDPGQEPHQVPASLRADAETRGGGRGAGAAHPGPDLHPPGRQGPEHPLGAQV